MTCNLCDEEGLTREELLAEKEIVVFRCPPANHPAFFDFNLCPPRILIESRTQFRALTLCRKHFDICVKLDDPNAIEHYVRSNRK